MSNVMRNHWQCTVCRKGEQYRVMSYRDYDAQFNAWEVMTDLVFQ